MKVDAVLEDLIYLGEELNTVTIDEFKWSEGLYITFFCQVFRIFFNKKSRINSLDIGQRKYGMQKENKNIYAMKVKEEYKSFI